MTQLKILNKLNKYVVEKNPDNVAYFANTNRRLQGYGVRQSTVWKSFFCLKRQAKALQVVWHYVSNLSF